MNLDLDWTVLVQIGFICILWMVLQPVLFDPLLKLYKEREKRTEGTIKRARRIDEESAEAKTQYDSLMDRARAEGNAIRDQLRAESLRKEADLLGKVRSDTQRIVDAGREQMGQEIDQTRSALGPHVQTLAKDLATRVLGRPV